ITLFGLTVLIVSSIPGVIGLALFIWYILVEDSYNALGEFLDTGIGKLLLILGRAIMIYGGTLGTVIVLWSLFLWKTRGPWFYYAMQVACVAIYLCDKGIILAVVVYCYLRFNKPEF